MIENVLIAVDGSECSRRAATVGLAFARRFEAAAEAIHVVEPPRAGDVDGRVAALEEQGERILRDVVTLADDPEPGVKTRLVPGRPSTAIVDYAAEGGFDLIVMGRHGRSGVGERLLGTVTDRVLRRSEVPVLTVPTTAPDADVSFEQLLLPTDGSERAEAATPYAVEAGRRFEGTVHVLSAVDVDAAAGIFDAGGVSESYVERLEARGRDATDRLADRIANADVDVRSSVVRGTPHEVVGDHAATNEIGLIVMASRGTSGLAGLHLGSVTARVLRTVDRPVLVVPS